jgi:plastocyanin
MPLRSRLLALLALSLLACRSPEAPPRDGAAAPSPAAPAAPAAAPARADLGTVEGVLGVDGTVPARPPLATSGAALQVCGTSVPDRALELGAGGALAGAVVAVQDGAKLPEAPPPTQPPVLDQRRCTYVPAVLAARAGSTLDILNSDPLVHTVRAGGAGPAVFSLAMPLEGMRMKRALPPEPGVLPVRCDVHPWMRATVRTFDHGHFTSTDGEGRFRLQLPAGTHTLVLWHPLLPEATERVEVRAGETVRLAHRWAASALQQSGGPRPQGPGRPR